MSKRSTNAKDSYFLTPEQLDRFSKFVGTVNNNLTEQDKKYCRCVLHVSSDQGEDCILDGFKGDGCYNPYAVCTKSTGRKGRVECFLNYDLNNIPPKEREALIHLKYKLLKKYNLPSTLEGLIELQWRVANESK